MLINDLGTQLFRVRIYGDFWTVKGPQVESISDIISLYKRQSKSFNKDLIKTVIYLFQIYLQNFFALIYFVNLQKVVGILDVI